MVLFNLIPLQISFIPSSSRPVLARFNSFKSLLFRNILTKALAFELPFPAERYLYKLIKGNQPHYTRDTNSQNTS